MKTPLLALAISIAGLPALANEFAPAMEAYLKSDVMAWSSAPILIDTLRAQNAESTGYAQSQIDQMDQAWRAEVGASASPTIDRVISNAAADFLREQVEASGGRITEVILMDATGLNAAVSHVTSDMWQGDEAKFQQTYLIGPDATHFGDIEQDESTGRYQGQISFSVTDPSSGEVLGAMTIGVDAESLL